MAPGNRSQSSAPAASTGELATPTLSFTRIPLNIPASGDTSSESMLWAPALDASFRLPELSSDQYQASEHPEFDDLGVHSRYMQMRSESDPLPQVGDDEPDLVILGSTPPLRRHNTSLLRATLVPHAEEVTMPTIGSVGGFRRTRHLFQELTGSSPPAPVPRVLPPQRPMTVADFAGVPYRYPPTNQVPSTQAWKRTAAAAEYATTIYNREAVQAAMNPGVSSARGYQYPRPSTTASGLTFSPAVGEAITPAAQNKNCSAARPPRNKTGKQRPVRRNAAKKGLVHVERRSDYVAMSDADALHKVQFDLVQRVNAQNAYLKMVLVNNFLALADASKYASKL